MIHVSVPNVGVVAFPDDFTPERIDAEIRQNFASQLGLQDQPAPIVPEATEAPGLFEQATRAVKGFFDDNNIRSAPASVSDSGYTSPVTGVFKDLATPGPSKQYDEQNEAVSKRVGNMPARMLRAGAGGMEAAGNLGNYQLPPKAESLSDLAAMPAQAALKFWDSLLGKAIPEDTKDNLKRDAQFLREATNDELQQNAANPAPGLPTLVTDTAGAVADMAPFIATGSAPLALGGMSAYAGGSKYADYIEQGKTPQQALHAGISTALAEGLSEKIPVSAILKKGQGKEWFDAIFGEGLQEGFMSLFEQTYDKTHLDNLSFADAVRNIDWNDAAYQAVIGSTVGGTLKTAATPVQALQQSAIDQQRSNQNRQQNSEAMALLDQVIQANNQQQPARDAAAQQQANNALRDKIKQDLATREERAWQKPPGTQPALVGETVIEPQVVRKIPVVPDEQITAPGQGTTAYPLGQGPQNPPLVLEDMRQPKTAEQYAEGLYKPESQAEVSDKAIQQPKQKQALASDTKPDVVSQPVTKADAAPFQPTHQTSDGIPVMQTDEPGVFIDEQGNEVEDDYAEPIKADQFLEGGEMMGGGAQEVESSEAQPAQPAKKSRSAPVETAKAEKIEDFGEVLQGARKHVYSLSETLDQEIDIKAEPLSKSFPKPDNEKLSAEGMDNRTIYAVNRLRKEIPNKPRASYRIEGWVRNTETTRKLVNSVMKGEVRPEDSLGPSHLIKNKYERELMGLVDEASPAQLDRLADFRLSGAHFSLYHGQKDVDKIQVTDTSKKSGFGGMANKTYFDTMEQAREFIRGEINKNVSESGQRQTSFDIWRERGKEGVFLGKKIASRKFIELRQFDDVKQAREYIEQNRAQLETDLKEKRKKKSFRRVDNNPRVGEDYRQGKDITPAEFEKAFGFRGVQFGNYVEDARRQQDLNNAYDGLRDLAGLLNIPTQAISLNGTLGLAFGARGKGGKNPASAHYEPGGKNINLTKKSGAGSLAHEWWHSLDNYFANMDKDSGFMSDRKRPAYIRPDGNFRESTPADFEVREEVYQAFKEIVRVIQKETGLVERSKEQDGNRTKDYWSTVVEMTARTFENYIIAKAAEQGHQSDYLANIVSEPKAEDAVKEYPYLLATEQPVVTKAFDKLFKTLKTKETDQGVALYKAKKQSQAQSLPESVVRRTVQALAPDVQDQIRIEDDFSALPENVQREARRQGINGDEVHGAWHNGTLYINRANMRTRLDVERVLFHELTHKGLAVMFRDKGVSEAMGNLYRAMGGPRGFEKMLKEFGVDLSAYGELGDLTTNDRRAVMVEELIAHIGEKGSKDLKTRVRELIGAIRNWLSKLGFKSLAGWLETATPSDLAWLAKAARETGQGRRTAKGNDVRFMVAWHGGPHDHNRFDSNYIGTGEGAQAYGWGHYFASRKEVAEFYRNALSGNDQFPAYKISIKDGLDIKQEDIDLMNEALENGAFNMVGVKQHVRDRYRDMVDMFDEKQVMDDYRKLEMILDGGGITVEKNPRGKLYQVNLAPAEDEYLLWDEPLSKQSEKVQKQLKEAAAYFSNVDAENYFTRSVNSGHKGENLYRNLAIELDSDKKGSEHLREFGIRGIKYLDGSSRSKGEGAYNYVIFNDADIEITAKFSAKKQQTTNPQQDADAAREAAEKITSAAEFIESLKGKGKQAIAKSLALLPRLALEEAGRNLLPEISHYVDIAQKMDADKVHNMEHVLRPEFADKPLTDDDLINKPELFFDVNDIADAWRKLPKPVARAMAELMHDATIEGADPAERFTLQYNPNTIDEQIKAAEIHAKRMAREGGNETEMQELRRLRMLKITEARRREKWEALKPRWNALPREAKQIYRDVRDAYAGRWEQIKQALEERIERADIGGKEKRKLINQLRMQFETAKVEGPYFPLARFGDFWVRAEKTGEEAIFSLAESEYAAKRWVQEMNARGYKAKFGRKLENAPQLEGASISFVTGIHDILAQVPGSQADKVADAVNQLYLQTLPALSIRKSFIHRGKVAGYSQDALRAFSHQMFHGGSQLAKLRYSDRLDDSIQAMKKQIEQASDPVLAASFYEEMVQRNEWAQNPKNARFTTFTSQAAFLWYLTTPAAAVINTTQTALVAYPVLAAKYGEVQTSKALTRAMADFMRGQGHIEEKLSGDERSAILQLIRDGVIDRTQAHTLAELADTDTSQYSAARHRAMSVVSWLFHHTERFNREVTALAAYRLARGKGSTHETAKKAARDAVYDSHFDYSNANRARFMQGDVMKMLTIFRQYSLNMTWLMLKKTYDSFAGNTPGQRKEARRFLANFAGMSFLLSGVLGLPLIQQLLDMAQALFGDDDDDHIDADALFRQYLVEATGSKTAGELIAKGPLNVVTGLDFHTRTKLTELWHRSPGRDLEAKAWWMDLMGQIAGPFWNIPVDMAIGAQMINEGHYQRGVEKMLPRALGALSKTERFATDGAENMRGDKLQDKFTTWELIGQAFGFTPAHLADRYDENNAKRSAVSRIDQQRYDLMNYFALAIRMGDEESRGRVLKKIQDFNRRHPHRQINGDSLKRSMLGKAKRSATGDHGFYASPRQSVGVRDIDFAAER